MIPLATRAQNLDAEYELHTRDVVGTSLKPNIRRCQHMDLRGRSTIDGGESELLSDQLQKLVANGVRKLLLNLADLTQVDSSGVSIIVGSYVSLKRQGGDLKLLCPTGRVLEVLTVLHLLEIIPSFQDEAEGLASFRPPGNSAMS